MRILMTGAGAPGAAGILKCLQKDPSAYILACDARNDAVGRFLNPSFTQIPSASSPDFIEEIFKICQNHSINIILPLVTRELPLFAAQKKRFKAAGINVIVSDEESLEIAVDKGKLYQHLKRSGVSVPDFYIAETLDEFLQSLEKLNYPQKQVCFKPCLSNGSRGFRIISETVDEFDLLFNQKPNTTYITYSKIKEILSSRPFPPLLVSEVLPGDEYSVDCLLHEGNPSLIIPRKRIKMLGGISVEGQFIQDPEIINYCAQILGSMKLHGNIGIQVKADEKGAYKILEINPRVQGTIVSALGAGVNLPLLAVQQELGKRISDAYIPVNWGVKFIRYWEEVFYREDSSLIAQ